MKLLSFVLFGVFIVSTIGCKMECCTPGEIEYTTFAKCTAPIEELIKNPNDLEDEAINSSLFALASSITDLARHDEFKRIVVKEADKAKEKSLNLIEFVKKFPEYETEINASLQSGYKTTGEGEGETLNAIAGSMIYNGVSYYPTLFVVNASGAHDDIPAVVAIGANVPNPNGQGGKDYIAGWFLDTTGINQPIMLDEYTAHSTPHPVIILSMGSDFTDVLPTDNAYVEVSSILGAGEIKGNGNLFINQYEVLCQYDNNASEYKYCYAQTTTNNVTSCCWGDNIGLVEKNDVAATFDNKLIDVFLSPLDLKGVSVVTYENDWYASNKTLCWPSAMSATGDVCVDYRAKYQHEWYQYGDIDCYAQPSAITMYGKGKIKFSWN